MESKIDLDLFIKKHITKRDKSLLLDDFRKYTTEMQKRISGKFVLVIGGAGNIGSSYKSHPVVLTN